MTISREGVQAYVTRKFSKEALREILDGDHETARVISNELVDRGRWSLIYHLLFTLDDKFYRVSYSRGATEYQEEQPWEHEGNFIDVTEVVPQQITVTKYVAKIQGEC